MQNTSNVLADIEAIIARAMEEVGAANQGSVSTSAQEPLSPFPWEDVAPVESPIIPERVNSVVVNEATSRFSGAVWYKEIQKQRVILAGCGGIGGYVAFLLGRFNIDNLVIYDNDIVETSNMSGQLYSRCDVGEYKVTAIAHLIRKYTELGNLVCLKERYTEDSPAGPIMICGFDNMAARKTFFHNWINYVTPLPENERDKCLFIDGRF